MRGRCSRAWRRVRQSTDYLTASPVAFLNVKLTRHDHFLIQAPEVGLFVNARGLAVNGQPVGNFLTPQVHGKWLQRGEDGYHDVAKRAGRFGLVVIHKNDFAAGFCHPECFSNGFSPDGYRLLVEQEKHHHGVVACIGEVQGSGVLLQHADFGLNPQLSCKLVICTGAMSITFK